VKKAPDPAVPSFELRETDGGVTLRVRVQPRASREGFAGVREGALLVRLTAPPVEGAANEALKRFLGKALRVAPSAVEVAAGAASRVKRVTVGGLTAAEVRARLEKGGGPAADRGRS
jgi:uncharacterized protein (TIGR00251 family)